MSYAMTYVKEQKLAKNSDHYAVAFHPSSAQSLYDEVGSVSLKTSKNRIGKNKGKRVLILDLNF